MVGSLLSSCRVGATIWFETFEQFYLFTRGMGLLCGENFVILASTVFD